MTAHEPDPTAEHIDAVASVIDPGAWSDVIASIIGPSDVAQCRDCARAMAGKVLTSTDATVHAALAASLPAEVKIASLTDAEMLAALVDRGTLCLRWRVRYGHGLGTSRAMRPGERAITVDGDVIERRYATGWEVAE